jgi:hypothetical protein
MAINSNAAGNVRNYISAAQLPKGSGEVGRFKTDITGVLLGIEPRGGSYEVTDRKTGELIRRPNSWTAYFSDGSMFAWPTYVDEATRTVKPWSRFDSRIDLAACIENHTVLHLWKDDRQFCHLEIAATQQLSVENAVPTMADGDIAWEF